MHFNVETGYIRHFTLDVDTCYKSAKLDWNEAYESACVSVYIKARKIYKLFYLSVFPIAYKGCVNVHQVWVHKKGKGLFNFYIVWSHSNIRIEYQKYIWT